jgi:hypothetical protein
MGKPKSNPKRLGGTKDGEIVFGHLHENGGVSSTMIRNGQVVNHYITMDISGPENGQHRRGSTTCVSPGSFQVRGGDDSQGGKPLKKDIPGIFLEAVTGDIVINAPSGRVRIMGQDVELVATGAGSQKHGNILMSATQNIRTDSKDFKVHTTESYNIVSDKTVEIVGKSVLNMYGSVTEMYDNSIGALNVADILSKLSLDYITSGDILKDALNATGSTFEQRAKKYAGALLPK